MSKTFMDRLYIWQSDYWDTKWEGYLTKVDSYNFKRIYYKRNGVRELITDIALHEGANYIEVTRLSLSKWRADLYQDSESNKVCEYIEI